MSVLDVTLNYLMARLQSVELWGIWSTFSLPLLPGPLRPKVVAPDRVLSMSPIELFGIEIEWKQMDLFNWTVSDTQQYLEPFNCVQTNNK